MFRITPDTLDLTTKSLECLLHVGAALSHLSQTLIFVLFVILYLGAMLGFMGAFGQILRQRREIASLRRRIDSAAPNAAREPPPPDITGV